MNLSPYFLNKENPMPEEQQREFAKFLKMRCERVPLQYITGTQEFMGYSFLVSPATLIPRQDTEILVEEVMKDEPEHSRILDMCTGFGCILISLLHYSNWCEGVGADISVSALKVAEQNACKLLPQEKIPGTLVCLF